MVNQNMTKQSLSPSLLILVVAFIGMMAPFSIDTYLPSFPAIEAQLTITRPQLLQSLSVYLISFAVMTLVWGPLSDRFGRRPVILVSLFGYLLASLLCAFAQQFEWLMLGRVLQGAMAAGSLVASRAMIRDHFEGQEAQKAMALMMMLFAVAPALAPIIGGWLEVHFGWRSVFYFLAAYAAMIVLLFLFNIPETRAQEHCQPIHPQKLMRSYWESLRHPEFLKLVVAQGALIGGFFVYVAGSASLIFDHLHLGEQDFWVFFVPVVSGMIVGSLVVHRLTTCWSPDRLIKVALWISGLSVAINLTLETWVAVQPWMIIAPLVGYAFGFAMVNPGLSIAALDCFPSKRGLASSVQSLFQMGTAGVVTSVVVPHVQHSLEAMALAQAGLFGIALVLWLRSRSAVVQRMQHPL